MKLLFSVVVVICLMQTSQAFADNNTASSSDVLKQLTQLKQQNQQLQQHVQQLQTQLSQTNQVNAEHTLRLQRLEKWVVDRSRPGRIINP